MTFHSVDLAIGAVLIVALWCIGVVFVGDPIMPAETIAPPAYCVATPVVAVTVPTPFGGAARPASNSQMASAVPVTAATLCQP